MSLTLHVERDPVRTAAERVAALLRRDEPSHVALSGGSTPRPLYRLLAAEYADAIPWERVTLYQVDERALPPDHPDSNRRAIEEEIIARLPRVNACFMEPLRSDAAADYEARLRAGVSRTRDGVPVLDLVLLGMGADGHTASLFPDSPALEEAERLVVENDGPPPHTRRLTLTYPVLHAADRRWFLVTGADKAAAFRRVRLGELPASRLRDTEWFVDPAVVQAAE